MLPASAADTSGVERRREPRFVGDQPVNLTVLRDTETHVSATVTNYSGRGIRVSAPTAIPVGSAVRIDLDDAIALAEVCYCQKQGDSYAVGLQLEQILAGIKELARLNRSLLGESDVPASETVVGPEVRARRSSDR